MRPMQNEPLPFGAKSVEEVAQELGASVATIRRYCRAGRMHAVKVGRRQLVLPDELRRFLTGREARIAA